MLNQPERHNAISRSMWARLTELFQQLDTDESVRAVILRGAGRQAFSSGADISEFAEERSTPEQASRYNALVGQAMETAATLSKPLVALIHGYCVGGGCELATCCDLRYCNQQAQFGIPMVKLGISMGFEEIQRLAQLVGPASANEILMLGRRVNAQRALEMGLVNAVINADDLDNHVAGVARELAENAPLSVQFAKRAIKLLMGHLDRDQIPDRDAMVNGLFQTEDCREGVRAFLEKRRPRFIGR